MHPTFFAFSQPNKIIFTLCIHTRYKQNFHIFMQPYSMTSKIAFLTTQLSQLFFFSATDAHLFMPIVFIAIVIMFSSEAEPIEYKLCQLFLPSTDMIPLAKRREKQVRRKLKIKSIFWFT